MDDENFVTDIRAELESFKPSIFSLFKENSKLSDYPKNIWEIWDKFIYYPSPEIQKPIILSYALTPSTHADNLPILLIQGISGSGKSQHSLLFGKIHESEPEQMNTSYAGFRIAIDEKRYPDIDPDRKEGLEPYEIEELRYCNANEKPTCLIFEDITPEKINDDPNFYALLRSGVSRDTDRITLSAGGRKKLVFRTFSCKVMSSVHPLYGDGVIKTNELQRRLLVIKHEKVPKEKTKSLLKLASFNYDGLKDMFYRFWSHRSRINKFIQFKSELTALGCPQEIEYDYFELCLDVLTSGLVCGFFKDSHDCLDKFIAYCEYLEDIKRNYSDVLSEALDAWIAEQSDNFDIASNIEEIAELMEVYGLSKTKAIKKLKTQTKISSRDLQRQIDRWVSDGLIERQTQRSVKNLMLNKGFVLQSTGYYTLED